MPTLARIDDVNGNLTESTDLRSAFERLQARIAQVTRDAAKVLQISSQASRLLEPTEAFFQDHPLVPDTPEYRGLCSYTRSLEERLEQAPQDVFADDSLLDWVQVAVTGAASCMYEVDPQGAHSFFTQVSGIRDEPSERRKVHEGLARHDPQVANMFQSAWLELDLPSPDQARGPAFTLRDALTHFLHHFAPDDSVRSQAWWEPHNGKRGISRADRVRFIYETQLIDDAQTPLTWNQLVQIKDLINELSKAHRRQPLEPSSLRSEFLRAQALLGSLLRVVRLPSA